MPKSFSAFTRVLITLSILTAASSGCWNREYPKLAPYTDLRWQDETPVVQINEDWYTLVSIDGIAAADIVAACKINTDIPWQQHFQENLVGVLAGMGHNVSDTVKLTVVPLTATLSETMEAVPMTEANHASLLAATQAREQPIEE